MLTIPNSIKTLFKTDGTRKNFRVKFPNGELPDITNDNIVRESVHFTESICSQSTFRFGLAEASVIEFETVGIPNMYGMTISCSYEIDTSSLSSAEIASIQSDPGDGELVLASASDIGYGFYRVPLGVFRVEKCPRNHGAMTHRQVTAYQYPNLSMTSLSPPHRAMLDWYSSYVVNPVESVQFALFPFVFANIGYFAPTSLASKYSRSVLFTESDMTSVTLSRQTTSVPDGTPGVNPSYRFTVTQTGLAVEYATAIDTVAGYDAPQMDYAAIKEYIETVTRQTLTQKWAEDSLIGKAVMIPGMWRFSSSTPIPTSTSNFAYAIPESSVYSFCPKAMGSGVIFHPIMFFPTSITVTLEMNNSGWTTVDQQTFAATTSTCTVYEFSSLSAFPNLEINLPVKDADNVLTQMTSGLYELLGEFGKADRLGGIEDFALSPSSPLSISPGDYDEVWWDEYDVSPIGTVTVTYRNGEEGEATANVTLGAGASLYDMTDNEVLKNLSTADLDSITTLLSGDFATNAQNVGFTPVELTMQGWPWLEAGDALQITAEDGTVVNTYALRVEMSGIQHLMSDIAAEGGEIIGEV